MAHKALHDTIDKGWLLQDTVALMIIAALCSALVGYASVF